MKYILNYTIRKLSNLPNLKTANTTLKTQFKKKKKNLFNQLGRTSTM